MKLAVDLSSVLWNCLLAGKDPEGFEVEFEGRKVNVNTANYGYENVVNSITAAMGSVGVTPKDVILVPEGMNSKAPRLMIDPLYKSGRDSRPPEAYLEFQTLRERIVRMWRDMGALAVVQDNCEGDDVLAWLAAVSREPLTIHTNDNDLSVLNGINKYGASIVVRVDGVVGQNKYGLFDCKYITVYKAMVGDTTDKISGIKGFGVKAWIDFHSEFGEAGMEVMDQIGMAGNMDSLAEEATRNKMVNRIYEGRADFLRSYRLAKLHPEWVNRMGDALQWFPGFVNGPQTDMRLRKWGAQTRLVTQANFDDALAFLKAQAAVTPVFGADYETSSVPESDDWMAARGKGEGAVDVIGAEITGASISFGDNSQFCYYISVDHKDTDNVTLDQLSQLIQAIPPTKLTVAHNAAGFELPVSYIHFGKAWADNGWRGMWPNMADTRIAASYWNENLNKYGLKELSSMLFGYEQMTYAEVTGGLKMNQLTGQHVLHYGCDDSYTAVGLWNFFSYFMQCEGTYDTFIRDEIKPTYLQAMAYVQGMNIDLVKLNELAQKDATSAIELGAVVDQFLVTKGWDGTVMPVITTLDNKVVKMLVQIVLKTELDTLVRTVSKMTPLIRELNVEGAETLASLIDDNNIEALNKLVQMHFEGKPIFNTGSPKQMQKLLYETLALPIRLRNKPTDTMRKAGIKEGTPRTDEDAIMMAIKLGDAEPEIRAALKALVELKSIGTRTGLYWEPYPGMIHWKTGKIHPSLRQSATNTRRFAGSDPNVQQMDSTPGGVRSVIIPHHKNAIVASLDESAQEVRLLADYCLDPTLLSCYVGEKNQLRDVHSIVACKIADCTYEEFRRRLLEGTDEEKTIANGQRQKAKITLFATLYGAAAPKIAEGLGITEEEAQGYIDAIYAQFPMARVWKEDCEKFARENGYVEIHGGTIRHLADLVLSEDKYTASKAMRQAGNAKIQAAGGTQIKRIMSDIWDSDLLDNYDYRWLMSVHDESVHSIGRKDAVVVLEKLHGFMTKQFLNVVPSASSIGLGKSFGDLIEIGEVFSAQKVEEALAKIFGDENAAVATS